MTTPDITDLCKRLRRPGLKSAAEAADTIERQVAEIKRLRGAAQAVVDRWGTPHWKDVPATAVFIGNLRAALIGKDT